MKIENEYRVRAVERFVVTHYQRDEKSGSCGNIGEFPSKEAADRVARALHESDVPSTYVTIEGEKSWAAPAPNKPQVGDDIVIGPNGSFPMGLDATVCGVHEWAGRRLLDVGFLPDVFINNRGGGRVLDKGTGHFELMTEADEIPAPEEPAAEVFCDYVIVAVKTFEIMAPVYHAQSRKEAEIRKAAAAREHNTEFEIFERPITDPVKLAQRRAGR
jgi:hypothetical protein